MRRCDDCCGCGTLDGECICRNCKGKGYIPETDEDKRILADLKWWEVYKPPERYSNTVVMIVLIGILAVMIMVIGVVGGE